MADINVETDMSKRIQDDKSKTNCVEFIADTLYSSHQSKELEDKSHPNDLLAATNA